MKHLKKIKERRTDQPTEFDLRGLGETSAIKAEFPLIHLSVQTKKTELVSQCASIFSLEIKNSTSHKHLYHLYSPRHDLNHKEKSIILFAGALYLSHRDPHCQMLLNEVNRLAMAIKNETLDVAEDRDPNVLQWMRHSKHLSVHPGIQLYLAQAGFKIEPQEQFQDYAREALTLLRQQSAQPQGVRQPKVVGE